MAAVAMLYADYLTVSDIIDVLSFRVATFLENVVNIGQTMKEHISFSKFTMAAAAMLDSDH